MKVKIPFKERFREPMLNGQKTMTSRTKRYGQLGDTFDAFGTTFTIQGVFPTTLGNVAINLFKQEGCRSTEDFVEVWKKIHPRKGFVADQTVQVHVFEKEGEG